VTYFARGDQENGVVQTHIGLLLDTSGSMGADIDLARKAAVRFLNTLHDAVDMTLVDFDAEVRVARYTQQDFPAHGGAYPVSEAGEATRRSTTRSASTWTAPPTPRAARCSWSSRMAAIRAARSRSRTS
jgi:hypothetical protein